MPDQNAPKAAIPPIQVGLRMKRMTGERMPVRARSFETFAKTLFGLYGDCI